MQKLKWYAWTGSGLPLCGIQGVRRRVGKESINNGQGWIYGKDSEDDFDIIAYTLGEPLEGDKE